MLRKLLLVGAGHAHLTILKNLKAFLNQKYHVTVINAEKYHYYSGMGPGMLSGLYSPEQIGFHIEKMVKHEGGQFIHDQFVRICPEHQTVETQSGKFISYDVVCFNIGSYVPCPKFINELKVGNFFFTVKPIRNLLLARNRIDSLLKQKHITISVVGGGAAGVEIAANVGALVKQHKSKANVILVAGEKLLNRFDNNFRFKAKTILKQYGIVLFEFCRVDNILNQCVILDTGLHIPCDMVIWATGILPSQSFIKSGLPTGPDGGLLVNKYLQCVAFSNIFGGGDCISFQDQNLDKAGVYAVRQSPILFENLINFLGKKPLKPFVPQKDYLIILNMGNHNGLLKWKNVTLNGQAAFWLKNTIDQHFMKTFQISKEREHKNDR